MGFDGISAPLTTGVVIVRTAEGKPDEALAHALPALQTAIDSFDKLGYPYWHAVTQTDLAAWHIEQHQPDPATPLLEQAITTFTALRATPALTHAEALTRTPTSAS